jgi:hypothetical protein
MQAERLSRYDTEVRVEHRMFIGHDPMHPDDTPEPEPDELFLASGPGGATFCSAGNDFHTSVRIEVWTAEPGPQAADVWEISADTTFEAPSGTFVVSSTMGGEPVPKIELGPAGNYRLRAHCRGRDEAGRRIGVELFYHGVEEWLLQIWPSPHDFALQS